MFKKFISAADMMIKRKAKKWQTMNIDKLFFEAQTDRYFLILKAAGKNKSDESVFLTIGNVFDENVFANLFMKAENTKKLFDQLGIRIKKIRILKKVSSADSAECIVNMGISQKIIKMSTVDAVRMAIENNMTIEVLHGMIKAEKFDLSRAVNMSSKIINNVFSSKFIERDTYNNNEVIM
jgi:hypothetical protein